MSFALKPSVKCVFVGYLVVANCKNVFKIASSTDKYKNNQFSVNSCNYSCKKRQEPPWRIIYFGADDFSLACLQPLNAKLNTGTLISGLGVVSPTHTDVYKYAASEKLPLHVWPPDEEVLNNYDMGIVVSYGKMIPERIINKLPLGVLNVHASLLPRWRGASPIVYAIMNGDTETGVSIMRIKPHKFDVGDIVRQYRCPISADETTPELREKLRKHAAILLMDCIRDLPRCLDMATPQGKDGVTYAPKISGNMTEVDWRKLGAQEIYNLHRAFAHKHELSTKWFDKHFLLVGISLEKDHEPLAESKRSTGRPTSHKSALDFLNRTSDTVKDVCNINGTGTPGKVTYDRKKMVLKIECADGNNVLCTGVKPAKGRSMSVVDFYNGYLSKKDKTEWCFT